MNAWLLRRGVTIAPILQMQLLSRSLPVFATSGTATDANSSNYNNQCQASGLPQRISFDISSLTTSQKTNLYLCWYNESNSGYDQSVSGSTPTNLPLAYTIETNTAAGGSLPGSGWSTAATVTGNLYVGREHSVNASGTNWVSMNISTSSGGNPNVKIDLYDATYGIRGIRNVGDSVTNYCMQQSNANGVSCDSFGNLVAASKGYTPPQFCSGQPGWLAGDVDTAIGTWLPFWSSKYVMVAIGTNDSGLAYGATNFPTTYPSILDKIIAAGKIPICPSIIWSSDAGRQANLASYNSAITTFAAARPTAIIGPDLFTYFQNNPSFIDVDTIHPTPTGMAAYRNFVVSWWNGKTL